MANDTSRTSDRGRTPGAQPVVAAEAERRQDAVPERVTSMGVSDDADPGLSQLVRDLAHDTRQLLRDEINLAKQETRQKLRRVGTGSGWIGAGVAVVALAGLCLVASLALGISVWVGSYWLGTLITGMLLLFIGGALSWTGVQRLRKVELAPTRTVETLKEDADWARKEAQKFKQELSRG